MYFEIKFLKMYHLIKKIIAFILSKRKLKLVSSRELETQKLMLGKLLSNQLRTLPIQHFHEAEFKVFSQWGDDGIIQYLTQHIDIQHKRFIEFGVENYTEAVTRFLLINNNWSGLVMDGSAQNIHFIHQDPIYFLYDIQAKSHFITQENIEGLLKKYHFHQKIGLLHIDIDGNDYYVWKAISTNPEIVIVEYNAIFGAKRAITVPYDPQFYRTAKHPSNLYFGASLSALFHLAQEKNYALIGCTSAGNNAFFIRKDKLKECPFPEKTPYEAFVPIKSREHRDPTGHLTFTPPEIGIQEIRGLPVFNVLTQEIELF